MVALHAVEKRGGRWTWSTFWWHDAPEQGPFAQGRPSTLSEPRRHYLMDVDFEVESKQGGQVQSTDELVTKIRSEYRGERLQRNSCGLRFRHPRSRH